MVNHSADVKTKRRSIAFARGLREILLELALDAVPLLGVSGGVALLGDIWPGRGVFGVYLEPFVEATLGIWLDRLSRTFRLADAAIDAFVRMDDEHILAFVEAVYRTYFDAVHVLALDAVVRDDIGHVSERSCSDVYALGLAWWA